MNALLIFAAGEGVVNKGILPHDLKEVFWGALAFGVIAFLLVWKAGPAIAAAWNGRLERIEGELDDAATKRADAEAELAEVRGRIANADSERQRILAESRSTAEALKAQMVAKAEKDAADIKTRSVADIESSKSQVTADLRADVAELALGAAEAVVAANLDAQTQNDLIEGYIAKVGASS